MIVSLLSYAAPTGELPQYINWEKTEQAGW